MRISFLLTVFVLSPFAMVAQWTENNNSITTIDDVGIGTFSPYSRLTVNGVISIYGSGLDGSMYQLGAIYSDLNKGLYFDAPKDASNNNLPIQFNWRGGGIPPLYIMGNGNVGIGTTAPNSTLHIESSEFTLLTLNRNLTSTKWLFNQGANAELIFRNSLSGDNIFNIHTNGAISIGTLEFGTHKLAVDGSIGAREIVVATGAWSDFVFDPNYNLPTLQEVESYIDQNGHLPDIPSAEEVKANGVSLGDMDAKLLQKIEELTLYLIELKKENQIMKNRITLLENEK